MAIRLSEIVGALELLSDGMEYVYDVVDQNILLVWDGMVDGESNPQLYEEIMENWDERYLFLPGRHEMNEYGMMEDFIESVTSDRKREILFNAIRGRGAFRRFKDTVRDLNLDDDWYRYRDLCLENIAKRWCEKNEIEYEQ